MALMAQSRPDMDERNLGDYYVFCYSSTSVAQTLRDTARSTGTWSWQRQRSRVACAHGSAPAPLTSMTCCRTARA